MHIHSQLFFGTLVPEWGHVGWQSVDFMLFYMVFYCVLLGRDCCPVFIMNLIVINAIIYTYILFGSISLP
jgi:hypothetical protein